MEKAEKKNKKLDARLEKRQKWLKEKKNISRLTRARVAQQNGSLTTTTKPSSGSTPNNKHPVRQDTKTTAENKGTKERLLKNKSIQKQNTKTKMKEKDTKTNSSKSSITVPPKSKNTSIKTPEKNNNTSENVAQDNTTNVKSKKSKNQYIDPVEKLVNSTSVHIPKRYVVLVKNLPQDISRDQVDEHFRKTGGVKSIRIPREKGTDNAKGYAYVEFNSTISHRIALRLHNTTLAGRKITVEFTPNDKKSEKKDERAKASVDLMSKLNMPFDT